MILSNMCRIFNVVGLAEAYGYKLIKMPLNETEQHLDNVFD